MIPDNANIIQPQPGFQVNFLSSEADIVIGGGSAGGGKTFAELLEPTRHINNKDFGCVMFRRTTVQITNQGGLWDSSAKIYPLIKAKPNIQLREWRFPSGAKISFRHLEHENNIYDHQGAQYALIIFDELTHFTKKQFFYMLSRNRSTCGVKPYIRATTNPDPDSWVASFIEWWIDPETGYPIPERAGVLRYMLVHDDTIVWGDSKQEVIDRLPGDFFDRFPPEVNKNDLIKSVTFIPGSVHENIELMRVDPGYLANLMAQDKEEKLRLLDGNWKISMDGLNIFFHSAINDLFTNFPLEHGFRGITCDAARFGRDLCVIFVWLGWRVVKCVILMSSDEQDIVNEIEGLRKQFNVMKSNVLIDQDGVGGGAVGLGGYVGFSGGAHAKADPETGIVENYENFKTQCFYRMAEKVNAGLVGLAINSETVIVVERSGRRMLGLKIKLGNEVESVVDVIKRHLKAIKKKNVDKEGKKRINTKEEQKIILNGESPDFADTLMMREAFEFLHGSGERQTGRRN